MITEQYGLVIDVRRCIGCRTCMLACKMINRLPEGVFRMKVYNLDGKISGDRAKRKGDKYELSWQPVTCMHCASPSCLEVCPAKAITKDLKGIVSIDDNLCIGCGSCTDTCPYNVPSQMKEYEKADKCDLCKNRVYSGKPPMCVQCCPGRAITFGVVSDNEGELSRLMKKGVKQIKPEAGTNPSVYYRNLK